ncbi:ATP-binding protein [Streptomyces murinus]
MPSRALSADTAPPVLKRTATYQFPRHRRNVGRARATLRQELAIWCVDAEIAYVATLLLSELVANAVNARTPRGREIRVRFELSDLELRVEVADASDDQPVPRHAKDDDESGRGLALVEALADRWGVEPRSPVGKVVWAVLTLPEGIAPLPHPSLPGSGALQAPDSGCEDRQAQ